MLSQRETEIPKNLSMTEVIELLDKDEKLKDDLDPITHNVPLLLPFRVRDLADAKKYTPYSFELQSLLTHLLVYKKTTHPVSQEPLSIRDIGTELTPNLALIKKVDDFLATHNKTRQDLLNYYGVSTQLYTFLLNFTPHYQRELTRQKRLGMVKEIAKLTPLFASLSLFYFYMYPNKHCIEASQQAITIAKDVYEEIANSFSMRGNIFLDVNLQQRIKLNWPMAGDYSSPDQPINVIASGFCLASKFNMEWRPSFEKLATLCNYRMSTSIFEHRFFQPNYYSLHYVENLDPLQYFAKFPKRDTGSLEKLILSFNAFLITKLFSNAKNNFKKMMSPEELHKTVAIISLFMLYIDSMTDCFGVNSAMANLFGTNNYLPLSDRIPISNQCAAACNNGYRLSFMNKTTGLEEEFYRMPTIASMPSTCQYVISKVTASIATIAMPVLAIVSGRLFGLFGKHAKKTVVQEFTFLGKNDFDYLHHKRV